MAPRLPAARPYILQVRGAREWFTSHESPTLAAALDATEIAVDCAPHLGRRLLDPDGQVICLIPPVTLRSPCDC